MSGGLVGRVEQLLELAGKAERIRMRAGSETLHAHLQQLSSYSGLSDDGRVAVETALQLARDDIPTLLAAVNLVEPLARDWQRLKRNETWVEHICGHSHRWRSEDKSTRCPVCGTSTFKDAALAAVSFGEPDEEEK